jgi:putative nucleotidyltransferase with HDIG domain
MNKHKILFVDDDPLILKGLNRSLEEYTELWDVDFASSGKEAVEILSKTKVDAIITDMQMPVMNGLALLKTVSEVYPGVLRFVLSGNANDIQAIKSATLVHQMFPKPCEMESLFQSVERSCRLKDSLSEPGLIRIITGIRSLPSKPALYDKLIDELQSNEPNIKNIGDIVSKDAAMTAKVLQLVNSAFFGLPEKISNPQRAISLLGINTTKALVLTSHVFSEYENRANVPLSIKNLWNHSMMVSTVAKHIAADMDLPLADQENAQVAGILHDIGKMLELKIPKIARVLQFQTRRVYVKTEYEILGTSHAEMGAYLLGIWGLPTTIVETVMYHHFPSRQIVQKSDSITALHLANGLVNMCIFENKTVYESNLDMNYLKNVIDLQMLDGWTQYIKQTISDNKIDIL